MDDLNIRIKTVMIDALKLSPKTPADIDDDCALFGEGLGLDSLDALQLAVAVEEKFGVPIADESAGKQAFQSINALASFIRGAHVS